MKIKMHMLLFLSILISYTTGCSSIAEHSDSSVESSVTDVVLEDDSDEGSDIDHSADEDASNEDSAEDSSDEESTIDATYSFDCGTLQGTIVRIEITDDRKYILIDTNDDDVGDKQLLVTEDVEVYGLKGFCELSDLAAGDIIAAVFSGETLEDDPGQAIDVSFILVYDPTAGFANESMTIQGTITDIDAEQSYLLIDTNEDGKGDRELSLLDDVKIYAPTGSCTLSELEVNQTIAAAYSGTIIEASPGIADGVSVIIAYK